MHFLLLSFMFIVTNSNALAEEESDDPEAYMDAVRVGKHPL